MVQKVIDDGRPVVDITHGEGGGGMVNVHNSLGKEVASLQSSNNVGLLSLGNSSGNPTKTIVAD